MVAFVASGENGRDSTFESISALITKPARLLAVIRDARYEHERSAATSELRRIRGTIRSVLLDAEHDNGGQFDRCVEVAALRASLTALDQAVGLIATDG